MPAVRNARHFVPLDAIPCIDGGTPVRELFGELARRNAGGFILVDRGRRPAYYVKIVDFARAMRSRRPAIDNVRVVAEVVTAAAAAGALVPISADPVDADADVGSLWQPSEIVFPVHDHGGLSGWFMNHDDLRATISAVDVVFVCARGHRNARPGSTGCTFCPGEFTDVTEAR
jgi:CBS domain-containing protein